jgi:hypothetical protein
MEWHEVEVIVVQERCDVAVAGLVAVNKLVSKIFDHHGRDPLSIGKFLYDELLKIDDLPLAHELWRARVL